MSASGAYPNIYRWFGSLIGRLQAFPSEEYVVLRWELDHAHEEEQYRRDLQLLDQHAALAAQKCSGFDRLIKERSKPGKELHGANRMILDKLAEIRAIAGLHEMGFEDITYQGTPDLSVNQDGTTLAVEVTRLSASSKQTARPAVSMLAQGDGSERELANEIFSKIGAKQEQLAKVSSTFPKHLIWVSLGRDYFTAGLYERGLTGLRRKMGGYASDALSLAVYWVRSKMAYAELAYVVLCPGREEKDIVAAIK